MRDLRLTFAAALEVAALAGAPIVEPAVLNAIDSGMYSSHDGHFQFDFSYWAGFCSPATALDFCEQPLAFRNFFVFDLAGLGPVSSATLRLANDRTTTTGTFTVFDVSTPISDLTGGTAGLPNDAIIGDLGSGIPYGSVVVTPESTGTITSVVFNAAGIAAINGSLGGLFAVGGDLAISGGPGPGESVAFFRGPPRVAGGQLEVESAVPEPASVLMLGAGLVGLAFRKRRA